LHQPEENFTISWQEYVFLSIHVLVQEHCTIKQAGLKQGRKLPKHGFDRPKGPKRPSYKHPNWAYPGTVSKIMNLI
jgi:hypothetical protein